VGAGVRRITAVTRHAAAEHSLTQATALTAVARLLRTSPRNVVESAERLVRKAARPG
jgi:alanyl-tRNA synthetase